MLRAAGWACYIGVTAAFVLLFTPALVVLAGAPRARYALLQTVFHGFVRVYTQRIVPCLGIYRIREARGWSANLLSSPKVYVGIHRSRFDGLIMLGFVSRCGVIIKRQYARLPPFSAFVKHIDFVSADPDARSSISSTMEKARSLLRSGRNLLIFPEGTRARSSRLQPFKDTAFRIASSLNVPVVPVVVHTDVPFLSKIPHAPSQTRTIDMRVVFLEPQTCRTDERPGDFMARIERMLALELKGLDAGTYWEAKQPHTGG